MLISYGAVVTAAACFAGYVRKERGHLLHVSGCLRGDKMGIICSGYDRLQSSA